MMALGFAETLPTGCNLSFVSEFFAYVYKIREYYVYQRLFMFFSGPLHKNSTFYPFNLVELWIIFYFLAVPNKAT